MRNFFIKILAPEQLSLDLIAINLVTIVNEILNARANAF